MNVTVRTDSGKYLPRRKPTGFSPVDGKRVFLWTIEQGHGGDGLVQRGRLYSFREVGKTFQFRIHNVEQPIRELRGRDLCKRQARSPSESSVKDKICKNRPSIIIELTKEDAEYLDQFYRSAPAPTGGGASSADNNDSDNPIDLLDDLDAVRNDPNLDETTRERLIQARLGQGRFRDEVMRRWRGACAVTGCTQPEALRASHIRPWRESSNDERLDPANGLLLAANLDALFDRFLISFDDDGHMRVSDRVEPSCSQLFGLPARLRDELNDQEKTFLSCHRSKLQA